MGDGAVRPDLRPEGLRMGYKYLCVARRPEVRGLPQAGLQYIEAFKARRFATAIKKLIWGYAVYNRSLTDEEANRYGLIRTTEG